MIRTKHAAVSLVALALAGAAFGAQAQSKVKVGFMLPYTGTYAALGTAIENGFKLYVQEQGGKLGGRDIEYFKVDDESEPSKAVDNINKLIKRRTDAVRHHQDRQEQRQIDERASRMAWNRLQEAASHGG